MDIQEFKQKVRSHFPPAKNEQFWEAETEGEPRLLTYYTPHFRLQYDREDGFVYTIFGVWGYGRTIESAIKEALKKL